MLKTIWEWLEVVLLMIGAIFLSPLMLGLIFGKAHHRQKVQNNIKLILFGCVIWLVILYLIYR